MKEDNSPQKDEGNNKDKINDLLLYNISKEKYQSNKISLLYLTKLYDRMKDNKRKYRNENRGANSRAFLFCNRKGHVVASLQISSCPLYGGEK